MSRKLPQLLFATLLSSAAGCSTETVVVTKPAPSEQTPDDGTTPDGTEAGCTASDATPALEASLVGRGAVAFSDAGVLALGYVDEGGIPTIATAGGAAWTARWRASKSVYAKYGAGNVQTALAASGPRFALAWYTERATRHGETSMWTVMFGTAGAGGSTSTAEMANDDYGRDGVSDSVLASDPHVAARSGGFLVSWNDRRVKEPTVMNQNIAGYGGIYARAFDASGAPSDAEDEQIAQPARADARASVELAAGPLFLWARQRDDFSLTVHARAGATFTPADEPAAVATTTHDGGPPSLGAVRLPGGDALVVLGRRDRKALAPRIGSLTVGAAGKVKSAYADWEETGLEGVAAAGTAEGAVVAAVSRGEKSAEVHVFFLDASGARTAKQTVTLPVTKDAYLSPLVVHASGKAVDVAVLAYPDSGNGSFAANAATKATVLRARACMP